MKAIKKVLQSHKGGGLVDIKDYFRALREAGFVAQRQAACHIQFKHPRIPEILTVSYHEREKTMRRAYVTKLIRILEVLALSA